MINSTTIHAIEVAVAKAWPPHRSVTKDGWVLRFSGGGSKRANSVLALAFDGTDLNAAIADAESAYAAAGQPPIFQLGHRPAPADLDDALAAHGYAHVDETLIMTMAAAAWPSAKDVQLSDDPSEEWYAIYLPTLSPDRQATARRIVEAVPAPRQFVVAYLDGAPAACGLGVVHGPLLGFECIATNALVRRRGAARTIMHAIQAWGMGQGASRLWLTVLAGNSAAIPLYEDLGFQTVGRYHYRIKL